MKILFTTMITMLWLFSLISVSTSNKMLLSALLFVSLFQKSFSVFHTSNETDLSSCQVYYSRSGTSYKDFFELHRPKTNDSGLRLDFHFTVLAASDAHILMATTKNPQKTDPAYEIVIGAGGNTFCDIRRMQKNQVKESVRVKGLLSALDPRSFWIHMTRDGVLEVGKEGEDLSFISWKDHEPLPVSTIGFSTWPGIEAKWYFDCKTDDIKIMRRNLTDEEKLRRDLLNGYDPMVRPTKDESRETIVKMAPQMKRISLDESKSVLHGQGVAHIIWVDEKLRWNKSAYGEISEIRVSSAEIWKPTLMVYNHFDEDDFISDQTLLVVKNTGIVYWFPVLNTRTWCAANSSQHTVWPKDVRSCDIIFTFVTTNNDLRIQYSNISNPEHHNSEFSDWIISELDVYTANNSISEEDKEYLYVTVELKRNSELYSSMFLATYVVICTSILCSFFVSPFGPYKISLLCFQLVFTMFCLICLAILVPIQNEGVPLIVHLHSYSVVAGVISIVISIIVINLSRIDKPKPLPNFLSYILTSKIIKIAFCLPEVRRDRYGDLSTMDIVKENQQYYILLGVFIDRLSSFIAMCFIAYTLHLY